MGYTSDILGGGPAFSGVEEKQPAPGPPRSLREGGRKPVEPS